MEYDAIQAYLDHQRELRKTDRERDIEKELLVLANKFRRALVDASAPLYAELAEIEARKPPMPVVIDGKVFEYTGPGALRRS